ncbi:hypothetical protein J3F84DRAFT_130791 [Trichoderma pleuroticola]
MLLQQTRRRKAQDNSTQAGTPHSFILRPSPSPVQLSIHTHNAGAKATPTPAAIQVAAPSIVAPKALHCLSVRAAASQAEKTKTHPPARYLIPFLVLQCLSLSFGFRSRRTGQSPTLAPLPTNSAHPWDQSIFGRARQ